VGDPVRVARLEGPFFDGQFSRGAHYRADLRVEKGSARMGEVTKTPAEAGYVATKLEEFLNWARKYSLFQYPFVTACCGMEYMSFSGPRYDMARFGVEIPRFSPRQADLLWVVGTISQRQAPILKRIYEQMCDPKYVLAFGTCASSGGFYDNYATVPGIDKIIPVDVYVPGYPPRPEAVFDGLMLLQDKIVKGDRTPRVVKPHADPVQEQLVKLHLSKPEQLDVGPQPRGDAK
jgi:NADH-quinone oxidoreductase subunit B